METLVANFTGTIRRETMGGREYIVAPLTMIVPGVLAGSDGPLYYPAEEISANYRSWDHIPIVVYHPVKEGKAVSARTPEVLNKQGIGVILNAHLSQDGSGKLQAEGWFDVEHVQRVDSRVYDSLTNNTPIELSTGLGLDQKEKPGVYASKTYKAIATNYRPDHLAILPDQLGACSLKDGCGVLINKKETDPTKENTLMGKKEDLIASLIANCDCWSEDDKEILNGMSEEKLQTLNEHVTRSNEAVEVANAARKGFEDKTIKVVVNSKGEFDVKKKEEKPPEVKPTVNKAPASPPAPQTEDEWFASAPESVRRTVANAVQMEQKAKADAIEVITKNETNPFSKDQLEAMDVDTLQGMAKLAKPEAKPTIANYLGASTPAPTGGVANQNEETEPLIPPTINWADTDE